MCAIVGMESLDAEGFGDEALEDFQSVLIESSIRGRHATGVSWYNQQIEAIISGGPADSFLKAYGVDYLKGLRSATAHCRYSTSDLRYHQPIYSVQGSLAHNGVVSQDPLEDWPELFGYAPETPNDSELLFRALVDQGLKGFSLFPEASIAAVWMDAEGRLYGYRNGQRPLWIAETQTVRWYASTRDILRRSLGDKLRGCFCCVSGAIYCQGQLIGTEGGGVDWQRGL